MICQLYYDVDGYLRTFNAPCYEPFNLQVSDDDQGGYPCLCEWSAMRYFARYQLCGEWIGFTSYRQDEKEPGANFRFTPEMQSLLQPATVLTWGLVTCDLAGKPISVAEQLDRCFPGLTARFAELLDDLDIELPAEWYLPGQPAIMCNYWAMRRDDFYDFMEWAEPIFELLMWDVPSLRQSVPRSKGQPITAYGAILERLVNVWIWLHSKKVIDLVSGCQLPVDCQLPIARTDNRQPFAVMLAMPGASFCWGSIEAVVNASRAHSVGLANSANGWDDFDVLWADALTRAKRGELTHFVMLHSDIAPDPLWIDTLIAECERLDADLISAVVPLKDPRGLTSTGVARPGETWGALRRFAIRELPALPATFTAADAGYEGFVLLVNSGCWVADLRKPIFRSIVDGKLALDFNFPRRIVPVGENYVLQRLSEDWQFSHALHALGAKYFATSLVKLRHMDGRVPHPNYGNWGRQSHDEETLPHWQRGPFTHLDIEGWFDFPDLYRSQVEKTPASGCAHFVEVGSWLGKSAAFMAQEIKHSGKRIRFDCVDNWLGGADTAANNGSGAASATRVAVEGRVQETGEDLLHVWERNLTAAGVDEYARPIRDDSTAAAARYADGALDFVFIDADHEAEAVYRDLMAWWPKLKPGATLAGHDYDESGPQEGVRRFMLEKGIERVGVQGRCFLLEAV